MADFFQSLLKDIEGQCKNIDDFNKELLKQIGNLNEDVLKQLGKTNQEVLESLVGVLSDIQKPITGKTLPKSYNPYAD